MSWKTTPSADEAEHLEDIPNSLVEYLNHSFATDKLIPWKEADIQIENGIICEHV